MSKFGLQNLEKIFVAALFLAANVFGQQQQQQTPPDVRPLPGIVAAARELGAGELHVYPVSLKAGQFLRVEIAEKTVDLRVALFRMQEKAGAAISDFGGGRDGDREEIDYVAAQDGDFAVVLTGKTAGNYTIQSEIKTSPNEADRTRIAAFASFLEGLRIIVESNGQKRAETVAKWKTALDSFAQADAAYWQIRVLGALAAVAEKTGDRAQVAEYTGEAAVLFEKTGDRKRGAAAFNKAAEIYANLGDLEKAAALYQSAGDNQKAAENYAKAARVQYKAQKFPEALRLYETAGELFHRTADKKQEIETLNWVGLSNYKVENYDRALAAFEQNLLVARELQSTVDEARIFENIGLTYQQRNDFGKALDSYKQSLELFRRTDDKNGQAESLQQIGRMYAKLGELEKAVDSSAQALKLEREINDKKHEAQTLQLVAGYYFDRDENAKAAEYYALALPVLHAIGDPASLERERDLLRTIGTLYSASGDTQKSLEYYQKSLASIRAASADAREKNLPAVEIAAIRASEAKLLRLIANVNSSAKNYAAALENFNAALSIYRELPDNAKIVETLYSIGIANSKAGENEKAAQSFQSALSLVDMVDDSLIKGRTYAFAGNFYSQSGDAAKAFELYQKALTVFEAGDLKNEQAATLHQIGFAYYTSGEQAKALDAFNRSLLLYRKTGNALKQARAYQMLGNARFKSNDLPQATENFNQSLALYRRVKNKEGEAAILDSFGFMLVETDKPKAVELMNQALTIYLETNDKTNAALVLNNLAYLHSDLGEQGKAVEDFSRALQIYEASGDKKSAAAVLSNLAETYSELGERPKAIEMMTRALTVQKELGDDAGIVTTINNLGGVYRDLGDLKKAAELFNSTLPFLEKLGNRKFFDRAKSNFAVVLEDAGETEDALSFTVKSLASQISNRDLSGASASASNIGGGFVYAGKYRQAIEYYQKGLIFAQMANDKQDEAVILQNLMLCYYGLNNPALAAAFGKKSVNVFQELRAGANTLDNATQKSYLRDVERTYQNLTQILIGENRISEAHQVLNSFKDQQFFDFDRDSSKAVEPLALNAGETAFFNDYDRAGKAIFAAGKQISDDKIETLATKSELSVIVRNAEVEFAKTAAAKPIQTKDTLAMQATLRQLNADTKGRAVAVYTLIDKSELRVLLVTPDGIFTGATAVDSKDLNGKIDDFRRALKNPAIDPRPLGEELYKIVFAPVAAKMPADTTTLLWSLDGALRYVPVAALFDGKKYLVERYQNAVFTRADGERMTRAASAVQTGAGFGSTAAHTVKTAAESLSFNALPAVAGELKTIFRQNSGAPESGILTGETFLDERFTRANFVAALRGTHPQIVHIASHFRFSAGDEARSFLLLGDGAPFTLAEIKREKNLFDKVELLALSACDTAAQQADAGGREIDGFAELAQRLGAGAVLATLWSVADESTELLMSEFYRLKKANPQMTKAEAMRRAQIEMIEGALKSAPALAGNRSDVVNLAEDVANNAVAYKTDPAKPFAHPFFWSPFVLFGNVR